MLILEWLPRQSSFDLVWLTQAKVPAPRAAVPLPSVAVVVGPTGAGGNRYVHDQTAPAALWTVNHNLGARPAAVTVLSPGGAEVNADVVHTSFNQLHVLFAARAAGRAVII